MKHIAMVVQRYGDDIVGGAESLARQLAEKISTNMSYKIDIYTTTATSYQTWAGVFKAGSESKNKICIKRFDAQFKRNRLIFGAYNFIFSTLLRNLGSRKLIRPLDYLRLKIEGLWFILQGPYCPELISSLVKNSSKYECVFFYTYLYYLSVEGQKTLNSKAILVPFAHDEKPLYFKLIAENFAKAKQILVNCDAERELILSTFKIEGKKISQAGIGIEKTRLRRSHTCKSDSHFEKSKPYILFMGRVCRAKGIDKLVKYFDRYKKATKNQSLNLIIAGEIDPTFVLKSSPGIEFLGRVSEEHKLELLSSCLAVVNPSDFESLSILVLEAICFKKPVLVNGHNLVLKSYTRVTNTVFSFLDSKSFSKSLEIIEDRFSSSEDLENDLDASVSWVMENYSWSRVLRAYETSINAVATSNSHI